MKYIRCEQCYQKIMSDSVCVQDSRGNIFCSDECAENYYGIECNFISVETDEDLDWEDDEEETET